MISDNKFTDNQLNEDPFQEVDELAEAFDPEKPERVCFHFFFNIIKGQCDYAWRLLSRYSQQKILDTVYDGIKETDEFYMQDQITNKEELRRAFETNNSDLRQSFWLRLAEDVKVTYLVEYAEFRPRMIKNNKTQVDAVLKLVDGTETRAPFLMCYENDSWRIALMEAAE